MVNDVWNSNIGLNVNGDTSLNKNLDISDNLTVGGSFKITGLTNAPQVKALYYNTTTGEITYDNSGSDVELNTYSDASLGDVDICGKLQVSHVTSISGTDLTFGSLVSDLLINQTYQVDIPEGFVVDSAATDM